MGGGNYGLPYQLQSLIAEFGHMGTNYHQDKENTSKFQQCFSYANSDKKGQNKEELSPRKDFFLQKSILWPDTVFEISNFLAHLRYNGVCWVQVLC